MEAVINTRQGIIRMPTPEEFQDFSKQLLERIGHLEQKVNDFGTELAVMKFRMEASSRRSESNNNNWVILLGGSMVLIAEVLNHFLK